MAHFAKGLGGCVGWPAAGTKHHFCTTCGIYTHHKRRSKPDQLGVNVAFLEGVSPFDLAEVVVYDGQRHPADNAEHKTYVAGVLRFEPASGD